MIGVQRTMGGVPKIPTKLKILRGNPGHQKLDRREPEPQQGVPKPPSWFDGEALRVWRLITSELNRLGIMSLIHGPSLEAACSAYSEAVRCRKILCKRGCLIRTPNGYEQQRPEVAIEQKAWALYLKFAEQFGLTPSALCRLAAPEQQRTEPGSTLSGEWEANRRRLMDGVQGKTS